MPEKVCPRCQQHYPPDAVRCPRDGATLVAGAASSLRQLVGRLIDERYRVLSEIGEGGMGVVFRGIHAFTQRPVAIKVLRAEFAADSESVARFLQEAQSASRIGHENIIEIYDVGVLPSGEPYFVMELLDGKGLADVVRAGALPLDRAISVGLQTCRGLAAAHRIGIIHRDIKPENLFLAKRPQGDDLVKILDFGIAKILDREANLTKAGAILGTPQYMSPEQSSGAEADARSDLYAVGVILYEMVTGRQPFTGNTVMAILSKQLLDEPVPPSRLRQGLWPDLEALILKALRKEPSARFQSAEEMEEALTALLLGGQIGTPAQDPNTVRASIPQPRHRPDFLGPGERVVGVTGALEVIQAGQQRKDAQRGTTLPLPASLAGARASQPSAPAVPAQTAAPAASKPALPLPASVSGARAAEAFAPTIGASGSSPALPPAVPRSARATAPQVVAPPPVNPTPPPLPPAAPQAVRPSPQPTPPPNAAPPPAGVPRAPMVAPPKPVPAQDQGDSFSWGDSPNVNVNASGDGWGDAGFSGGELPSSPLAPRPSNGNNSLVYGIGAGIGGLLLLVVVYFAFLRSEPEPEPAPPAPAPVASAPVSVPVASAPSSLAVAPTEPVQEPAKEPSKEPAKEPVKEPAKEPTKEPVKEPSKEPSKEPAKEAKTFKLMSNPSGAQVSLGGSTVGTTPLQLTSAPESRTFTVKKEGYKTASKTVAANSSSLVIVTLEPDEPAEPKPAEPKPEKPELKPPSE